EATLIDCGGGSDIFNYIKMNFDVRSLYLTHYHLDHVWGAHLFDQATVYINPYDYKKLTDPYELAKANGVTALYSPEKVERWVHTYFVEGKSFRPDLPSYKGVMGLATHVYPFGQAIETSGTQMVMLHTPGHTEGFCSPYFPEVGVLFVGDFDLTSFGPWYNNADSDIDAFIQSAKLTLETDAEIFITAHHKGTYTRKDYTQRLADYIGIISKREDQIKRAIETGLDPMEIVWQGIFYYPQNHEKNRHLMDSEIVGIAKHIMRLIKNGHPFEAYFQDFVTSFNLKKEALDYKN
ncbi:MAG TPA: MBL fold metallo-hydrolase, partial [Candidatus Angelobacter sp.]|nr:MBL fold metallo-hydrolase [Candidatus Angelobacter sp.]